jgi:polyhydroxybutyrate depolymerase
VTRRVPPTHDPPPPSCAFVALVACTLLLTACAPRVPASDSRHGPHDAIGQHRTAQYSPGCSTSDAWPLPERLVVSERDRTFIIDPPRDLSAAPHDLVIAFHGRTNDAAQAREYFELAEAMPNAWIVYPQALPAAPGTFAWSDPGDPINAQRDFGFVAAIVDAIGATRCIDLDRVFAVGHSLGAYAANDLACHTAGLVRAVASVAGGLQGGACVARTAALLLHHPDDQLVPIGAGEHARDAFLAANGLHLANATSASQPALAALRCQRIGAEGAPHPVVWCPHDDSLSPSRHGDPHGWPAGTAAAIAVFFGDLP